MRIDAFDQAPSARDAGRDPGVLAAAATGLVEYIEAAGGDIDRIFGHAGIAPAAAGSPTLKLSLYSYCALFEEASRRTGNGNFGLWFGQQFQPRDLGLWGYAAVSAPTLGAALSSLVELLSYHQECSAMRLVEDRDFARLEYQITAPDILDRRQDAELSLGMFQNVVRECLGSGWAPEEVHFEHPRAECSREHERAFGAPVYFSQPTNALLFRPQVLAARMPAADPRLMLMMRTCLERLGGRGDVRERVSTRIRRLIRTRLVDGVPSLVAIAAELRLPAAAIQRELDREGLGLKELVEETRRELALGYLRQRHLPLSEIALLLGYSELSAFSRAVRRWTGQSPRALRATGALD